MIMRISQTPPCHLRNRRPQGLIGTGHLTAESASSSISSQRPLAFNGGSETSVLERARDVKLMLVSLCVFLIPRRDRSSRRR
jgi:hypothetical protein